MTSVRIFKPKACATCGAEFIPASGFQKYCSKACKPWLMPAPCLECGKVGRVTAGYCDAHYKQVQIHGTIVTSKIRFMGSNFSALDEATSWVRDAATGCLLWQRATYSNGYGMVGTTTGGKAQSFLVHRLMYEREVGPIPAGMDLDHLCFVKNCAEVTHLEPVTRSENIRRGYARKNRVAD